MPFPLLLFGGAAAIAISALHAPSGNSGIASTGDIQIPPPDPNRVLPANMTSRDWTETLHRLAPDIPIGFMLAWIEWESGGNPCAGGAAPKAGYVQEAGIAQVNFDTSNSAHGTTSNHLRGEDLSPPICTLSSWQQQRAMTQPEADAHALVNIAEMRSAIASAKASVPSWTGPDFYAVAKTWHGYPGLPACFARAVAAGHTSFVDAMNAIPGTALAGQFQSYTNLRDYKDANGSTHRGIFDGAWAVGNGLNRAGQSMTSAAVGAKESAKASIARAVTKGNS